MLVSSKSREQAGSFAGLVQVGGAKGSLLLKLLEAYLVILFGDGLADTLWYLYVNIDFLCESFRCGSNRYWPDINPICF